MSLELERIRCTNCGSEFSEYDPDALVMRCDRIGCGATFRIKQAKEFAKIEVDHETDIRNLRLLLDDALATDDMALAAKHAGDIRRLIPDDAFSAYCEALGQKKRGNYNAYHAHLKSAEDLTEDEANKMLRVALKEYNFTIHDEDPLCVLIDKNLTGDAQKAAHLSLDKAVKHLAELKDRFTIVPRDVFICHSSSDPIARAVYDTLTEDGVKCWFSPVNLPPSIHNYWDHIRNAIRNCKIILVIASKDSMLRDDPEREMGIAASLGLHRLELKIDNTPHNTFFRHYFDGIQWVYLGSDVEAAFRTLKQRVYELLNPATPRPAPQEELLAEVEVEPVVQAISFPVTVAYLGEDDSQLNSYTLHLSAGTHAIRPRKALIPEGYVLVDAGESQVTVTDKGADTALVTFRFALEEKQASVSIIYQDKTTGKRLAQHARQLPKGTHTISPDATVLPEGYKLLDDEPRQVQVKEGAVKPESIVFRCGKTVTPVVLNVLYLNEQGKPIARAESRPLEAGTHKVFASPKDLLPGYQLMTPEPRVVTVNSSSPGELRLPFVYRQTTGKIGQAVVERPGDTSWWGRLGNKLVYLAMVLWLLGYLLYFVGDAGGLYGIGSELPFLVESYYHIARSNYWAVMDIGLPIINRSLVFNYYAVFYPFLILLGSLLFGLRCLGRTARRLFKAYWALVLPANILYFWVVYIPAYGMFYSILQDKLVAFLLFMLPVLLMTLLAKAFSRVGGK